MKITDGFYCEEKIDTRLKFSIAVSTDKYNEMAEFKPIENFGFQDNFRKSLDSNEK